MSRATGAYSWSSRYALKGAAKVLAVGSAQVYATCGAQATSLCAYGTATGSLRWQILGGVPALIAEAGGVLYLDGGFALSTGNGNSLRSQLWHGSFATLLAVGNGRLAAVIGLTAIDLYGLSGS